MATPRAAALLVANERRFWRVALALILGLGAATGLVAWRGNQVGLAVTPSPAAGAVVSGRARITLTFPAAMDQASVESRLTLAPPAEGRWSWEASGARSDRVAQFIPARPLAPGATYRATLVPGARAANGRAVTRAVTWQFAVRPGALFFLRATPGTAVRNLWEANPDGTDARAITNEAESVLEYSPAPDGSRIAYTTQQGRQGTALWAIDADGANRKPLSPSGDPSLYGRPAWSPAGDVIVYVLRSVVPPAPGTTQPANAPLAIGASKLWAVAPDGKSLGRIYGRGDEVGFDPVWSPDGTHLAFREQVNERNEGAVVLSDLAANPVQVPAGAGSRIAWSPDGTRAAFDEIVPDARGDAASRIRIVDASGANAVPFPDARSTGTSAPAWSPDGARIAFLRSTVDHGIVSAELWVAAPDGGNAQRLTTDDGFASSEPVWAADGQSLLVTRANIAKPEEHGLWLVRTDGSGARLLIPAAEQPTWVP